MEFTVISFTHIPAHHPKILQASKLEWWHFIWMALYFSVGSSCFMTPRQQLLLNQSVVPLCSQIIYGTVICSGYSQDIVGLCSSVVNKCTSDTGSKIVTILVTLRPQLMCFHYSNVRSQNVAPQLCVGQFYETVLNRDAWSTFIASDAWKLISADNEYRSDTIYLYNLYIFF